MGGGVHEVEGAAVEVEDCCLGLGGEGGHEGFVVGEFGGEDGAGGVGCGGGVVGDPFGG